MPQFTSKLQYKTCEDQEYYDEKERSLEETLDLINNFPWEREQYAELGLTGPSITIEDNKGMYLKAGIHYGGKYTLYYLDEHNHLYTHKSIDMEIVLNVITDFFSGSFKAVGFEKQSVEWGVKKLFITKSFEYRSSVAKILKLHLVWISFFLIFFAFFFIACLKGKGESILLFLGFALLTGIVLFYSLDKVWKYKNQYLKISRANPEFLFGTEKETAVTYQKADIVRIICFSNRNYNSPNMVKFIEVGFQDGSSLRFTNALISRGVFLNKFSDRWKIDKQYELVNILSSL